MSPGSRASAFVRRLKRGRGRAAVVLAVVAGVTVPLAAAATGNGYPVSQVAMSGGGAWLASVPQGLMTLIDGASEQVIGSLKAPGARAGDALSVVQSGASAYAVNGSQGTVARVDGGTYEPSAPVRFGQPSGPLAVHSGPGALYVLDAARALAAVTDPLSLRVREQLALAARPGPGQSVVDQRGRLWVIDGAGGGIARFDGSDKRVRPDVGDQLAQLVLVRGEPVLVDLSRPRLGRLDADGDVRSWSCLEIRARERVQLLGSATSSRVFAAVAGTGTLVVSSVDDDDCATAVVIGKPGDDFGPLVEVGNFVLVPNRSTGQTTVVDVAARRKVVDLTVVRAGARLELIAKDSFVFYNNLDGDDAGVIRLEGGTWRKGKTLRKYDPSNGSGPLLLPGGPGAAAGPAPQPSADPAPPADAEQPTTTQPTAPDVSVPLPRPPQPPPDGGLPPPEGSAGPGPAGPDPSIPAVRPVIRDITWSPDPPVWKRPVTFTATVDNAERATWRWTLTAEDGTVVRRSSAVGSFRHTPTLGHGSEFRIALSVTGPGGTAKPMSKAIGHLDSRFQPEITSLVASDRSPVVGQEVTFSAEESVAGSEAEWSWEISDPETGGWTVLRRPPQRALTHTFTKPGPHIVALLVVSDQASDRRTIEIEVAPRPTLERLGPETIRLSAESPSEQVRVRLRGGTGAQRVSVVLRAAGDTVDVSPASFTLEPDETGSVAVRLQNIFCVPERAPPCSETLPNALILSLANGFSLPFDIAISRESGPG